MKRLVWLAALVIVSAACTPALAQQFIDGKPIYEENCRECHGPRGVPPQSMQVKYERIATFNALFIKKRSVDSLVKIFTKGKGKDMKSFKDKMSKDEMTAVAAYVRELAQKSKS